MRLLYHLMRADFLERVRRYSFLVVLAGAIYLGHTFVPPRDASYGTLNVDGYQGVYNSAWIGTTVAMMTSVCLSLFGFYVVRGAVERDDRTRVGQLIAATPLGRPMYLLGKWLSNFTVLATMVGILVIVAAVMQVAYGEAPVEVWPLLAPFLFMALPMMALTAALALVFDVLPFLSGTLGSVAYFFLWMGILVAGFVPTVVEAMAAFSAGADRFLMVGVNDPMGITIPMAEFSRAVSRVAPDFRGNLSFGYTGAATLYTIWWDGVVWTPGLVLQRLAWVLVAVGMTLAVAPLFHRFDPARQWWKHIQEEVGQSLQELLDFSDAPAAKRVIDPDSPPASAPGLSPLQVALTPIRREARFWSLVRGELRLALKGLPWWWYLVASLLWLACLAPLPAARQVLPFVWIWPLPIWSALGTREERYNTRDLVFSAPRPLRRQLMAAWVAGIIVTVLTGSGAALRFLVSGAWANLAGWLVGALFIPTLALALGVWSGSNKLFEVIYTIGWYIGPVRQTAALDFMGVCGDTRMLPFYLLATAILLPLAVVGRKVRIV